MAKKNEIRAVSVVTVNGTKVILDDLPPEKRAEIVAQLRGRFARQLESSLNSRPDEARRLLERGAGA